MATSQAIALIRGDSFASKITIKLGGVAQDPADFKIWWTIKTGDNSGPDNTATLQKITTEVGDLLLAVDAIETTKLVLSLTAAQTGVLVVGTTYNYDVQVRRISDGFTKTVMKGNITVEQDTTQSTS